MAMLSKLLIRRLRNVVTTVSNRVFGAPTFFDALMNSEYNVTLPAIFVIDERDSAEPIVGGQVSYQEVRTEVDIAVAISRLNHKQDDKDTQYVNDLSTIKDKLFEAMLNWGIYPANAVNATADVLDDVDDHGSFYGEYVGSDTTLARNGYLFHIFTFAFTYIIEGQEITESPGGALVYFQGDIDIDADDSDEDGDGDDGDEEFEVTA